MLLIILLFITILVLGLLLPIILYKIYYKKCNPNERLIISGINTGEQGYKLIEKGGVFVLPLLQECHRLSLEPITLKASLKDVPTADKVPLALIFKISMAVDPTEELIQNASKRILSLSEEDIATQAEPIIFAQTRKAFAKLDLSDIDTQNDVLYQLVKDTINADLKKLGLKVFSLDFSGISYADTLKQT